ncbi:hypothetical protein RYX36_023555, partial [Vicia faba]
GLGSHQTTSSGFTNNDESKDYDSTASMPKVDRINCIKNLRATTIKPTKSKFTKTLGTKPTPPKFKIKKERMNGLLNKNLYNMLKKNLFFLPEEEDDNDFILNFHPSSNIGYEASDTGFFIPEIFYSYQRPRCALVSAVVDLLDRDLIWLDFMPSAKRNCFRRHAILFVDLLSGVFNSNMVITIVVGPVS